MEIVLYHKFTQHKGLKRELLATGDAELIEVQFHDRLFLSPDLTDETASRTRTRIHSGGVGRMGRVGMSLGRHSSGFVKIYANRSEIAGVLPDFLYAGSYWTCITNVTTPCMYYCTMCCYLF